MNYATQHRCGEPRHDDRLVMVTFCESNSSKQYSYFTNSPAAVEGARAMVCVHGKHKEVVIRSVRAATGGDYCKRLMCVYSDDTTYTKKLGEEVHERMQMMLDADIYQKLLTGKDDTLDPTHWPTLHFAATALGRTQCRPDFQPLPQENTMKLEIIRVTYVNGCDIKEMNDAEILSLLKAIDKEVEKLSTLNPIPGRFQRKIEELTRSKAELLALLEEVDGNGQQA